MAITAEREYKYIGASRGCEDHNYDLVHELSHRLNAIWHYDQRIANAEDRPELQNFWRELKKQDETNVSRLKEFIASEVRNGSL